MKVSVRTPAPDSYASCDECGREQSARYRVETKALPTQLDLCPKCFGQLLREIVTYASEML